MTITNIEKAAKLMVDEVEGLNTVGTAILLNGPAFNPYTNKADLVDVECELGIDIEWNDGAECVHAVKRTKNLDEYKYEFFSNHPDKFTARAHAAMAVVEQIYDRTNP